MRYLIINTFLLLLLTFSSQLITAQNVFSSDLGSQFIQFSGNISGTTTWASDIAPSGSKLSCEGLNTPPYAFAELFESINPRIIQPIIHQLHRLLSLITTMLDSNQRDVSNLALSFSGVRDDVPLDWHYDQFNLIQLDASNASMPQFKFLNGSIIFFGNDGSGEWSVAATPILTPTTSFTRSVTTSTNGAVGYWGEIQSIAVVISVSVTICLFAPTNPSVSLTMPSAFFVINWLGWNLSVLSAFHCCSLPKMLDKINASISLNQAPWGTLVKTEER
ncbi:hypothetical protein VF21_07983 [Pseudogymnoascus sp. 05NY08]|nr:hypothetical protein VF21_07983 [Pseudogymnoascus sp. 05NY08]